MTASPPPSRGEAQPSPRTRAVAIVPARLGSTRMQQKMLRRDTGRYLFEHTVRNAERAHSLEAVHLATDSPEIERAAREVGIPVVMTSAELRSGSDRVHAALGVLREQQGLEWDVVVNVQGDEPELSPAALDDLVARFEDPAVELATLACPLEAERELEDPNVVKVVTDARGRALYFSRAAIPARAHPDARKSAQAAEPVGLRHVGVYAFRPRALARFCALEAGRLERIESLEQLRWLEAGGEIDVVLLERASRDINTEEQYREFASRHGEERSQEGLHT